MGLLDWLTDGGGDMFGSNKLPFINATNSYSGPGGDAADMMPPPAPTGAPPMPPMPPQAGPYPMGGDPMDGTGSGNNGGLPPGLSMPPGLPMPAPRPPGADMALPPNAAPTAGGPPMPPPGLPAPAGAGQPPLTPAGGQDIVRSYEGAGGNAFAPPSGGGQSQAQTILGRALGLDGNRESQLRGSIGAGLKAAGNSSGKSPFQAFASGAGEGIEGGKKADDKTTEQQDKYLARAIAAKKEGNNAAYQQNYLRYQIENAKAKLAASKEKAAGGASVMNSPEQLYLRGVGATNADGELKILANKAKEAEKIGDTKAASAAMEAYNKRRQEVLDGHLKTLGVDPNKVKGLESKPGFSDKNPVKDFPRDPAAAQKAFDALPDGAYFINPKDGRLLMKRSSGGAAAPNPAQPQQAADMGGMTPPMPPIQGMTPDLEAAA